MTVLPGEVLRLRPAPTIGREQTGWRPVVVVSNELFHETVTTLVLVVPVTSVDRGWDNHVALSGTHGLPTASFAMTEQVRVASRDRIVGRSGLVDTDTLTEIRRWVTDYMT